MAHNGEQVEKKVSQTLHRLRKSQVNVCFKEQHNDSDNKSAGEINKITSPT